APPDMKIETITGGLVPAAAADAMPSSQMAGLIALPPYTASASPPVRARKERRFRPVPAGVGMPASIARRPLPAWAAPARRNAAREKSLQWQAGMLPQQVW